MATDLQERVVLRGLVPQTTGERVCLLERLQGQEIGSVCCLGAWMAADRPTGDGGGGGVCCWCVATERPIGDRECLRERDHQAGDGECYLLLK